MKRTLLTILLILSPMVLISQQGKKLVILHTNDLHSRLYGFAPESAYSPLQTGNDKTTGGFARIATILKSERERNEGITLTIDAGDFLMGTLFHSLEAETGFQLRLMEDMGYDMVCLGNHEFDFGPGKLAQIIEQAKTRGRLPAILSGNAVFDPKSPDDDGLENLYADKILSKKLILEKEGLKIGFFSILGIDAANVAPGAKPVTFSNQIRFAKKMVEELRADKCDIIICVSHSGVSKKKDGSWGGDDVELAKSVSGINLIISGHTHTKVL
ncbi:MAG: metallophosphoesterase [Bacteroidota bacterium]|nr:metallophosphoesterase [Bacteroidota bacterium]